MPDDDGVEVMCTISLSPLHAATLRQRLDEMGESVIMSQVGGNGRRWKVPLAGPCPRSGSRTGCRIIGALGEPTQIRVSELALPREPRRTVNSSGHDR